MSGMKSSFPTLLSNKIKTLYVAHTSLHVNYFSISIHSKQLIRKPEICLQDFEKLKFIWADPKHYLGYEKSKKVVSLMLFI